MRGQAQRFGGEQGEGVFGFQHVHDLQVMALQHAFGGFGHHAAVFDIEDGRAHHRLRLHIATDEHRQRFMAQRFVEIVGDVFGEAALHQVLLRIAGHHDHRHVGLACGFTHAAGDLQAVAIGQGQRRGDQVHRTGFQRLACFGNRGAANHLDPGKLALQHVGNHFAHHLRTVHHHDTWGIADQMAEFLRMHAGACCYGRDGFTRHQMRPANCEKCMSIRASMTTRAA